jgi:hypothetical protein
MAKKPNQNNAPPMQWSQLWGHIAVISGLWRLKQEDHEFEASLGYIVTSKTACIHRETLLKVNRKKESQLKKTEKKKNQKKPSNLRQPFQE